MGLAAKACLDREGPRWHNPRTCSLWVLCSIALIGLAGRPAGASTPARFAITNVTSDNASVVWASPEVESGLVELAESVADLAARTGTFRIASDDGPPSRAHHVTLGEAALFDNRLSSGRPPLKADTSYVFDIVSGGVRFDNDGAHFTLRTAKAQDPRLSLPEPATVTVVSDQGTAPPATLLLYRLVSGETSSQMGSGLVLAGEGRILDLSQLLDADVSAPWVFSGPRYCRSRRSVGPLRRPPRQRPSPLTGS